MYVKKLVFDNTVFVKYSENIVPFSILLFPQLSSFENVKLQTHSISLTYF